MIKCSEAKREARSFKQKGTLMENMKNIEQLEKILADIRSDRKKKVIIDTDAYNEVDDQFAIAYALGAKDKMEVLSINAAPFYNGNSLSYEDGMERSYEEILRVTAACGVSDVPVFKGSRESMDATGGKAVYSPAARNIIDTAMASDEVIYILGLGAATNIASALALKPEIKDRIAIIWLGGTSLDGNNLGEFNLAQDFAAGAVLFDSEVPLVLCPAWNVVCVLYEQMAKFDELKGVNAIGDYLHGIIMNVFNGFVNAGYPAASWGRTIWDIAAPALLGVPDCGEMEIVRAPFLCENSISGERLYGFNENRHGMIYLSKLDKDMVYADAWENIKKF